MRKEADWGPVPDGSLDHAAAKPHISQFPTSAPEPLWRRIANPVYQAWRNPEDTANYAANQLKNNLQRLNNGMNAMYKYGPRIAPTVNRELDHANKRVLPAALGAAKTLAGSTGDTSKATNRFMQDAGRWAGDTAEVIGAHSPALEQHARNIGKAFNNPNVMKDVNSVVNTAKNTWGSIGARFLRGRNGR